MTFVAGFFEWTSPLCFLEAIKTAESFIPDANYRDNASKRIREGRVLGLMGLGLKAEAVRMTYEDPPDGQIRLSGRDTPVEVVEALDPTRKPHQEAKTAVGQNAATPAEWDYEEALLPEAIICAIERKKTVQYGFQPILGVYSNLGHAPRKPNEDTVAFLKGVCSVEYDEFKAVAIVWRNWVFGPLDLIDSGRIELPYHLVVSG